MTCHVLLAGPGGAVMLSDSQGSTSYSESHGIQKLVPCADFLIGGTGASDLIGAVVETIVADPTIGAANISTELVRVVDEIIRPSVQKEVEFVVATERSTIHYRPGRFTKPVGDSPVAVGGSGAEFVIRALDRDRALGIDTFVLLSIADTFVAVEGFLDAANESLTVDDQLMVGFVRNGRTYVAGHQDIQLKHVPKQVKDAWNQAADNFERMKFISRQIRSELRTAQRALSPLRVGGLGEPEGIIISASNASIAGLRVDLENEIVKHMGWYDGILGRSLPIAPTVGIPGSP